MARTGFPILANEIDVHGAVSVLQKEGRMTSIAEIRSAYVRGQQRAAALARASVAWWLEEVETLTEQAEAEATRAVAAALKGNFRAARRHARQACRLETIEYHDCTTWRPLLRAVAAAWHESRKQAVLSPVESATAPTNKSLKGG
jgi:hypothetical protein